jgi:hypothetical protein
MFRGTMLVWVTLIHIGVGGIYHAPLVDMLLSGVLASAPDFGDRATAFWVTVVLVLAACVRDVERRGSSVPTPLVPGLIGLTLIIVVPMPNSGASLFALVAAVAQRRSKTANRAEAT